MAQGPLTEVFRTLRRLVGAAPTEETDAVLLERFRKERDEAAFARLLERHGPLVVNVCRRMLGNVHDADDAFQATFLVLARKADTIRRGQSLSSWLHGVACRVSLKARARAARLRLQERQACEMNRVDAEYTPAWNDLRPVLDEELSLLPEKYRLPVVLRYLEGKSHEETARALGWPGGSVSWRLSRALELLKQRLARRGVTLPGATLGVLLTDHGRTHAVAPALADATLHASMNFLAGQQAAPNVSGASLELAQGVIKTMWFTNIKWLAVTALLLLGVAGLGVLGWQPAAHTAFVPADGNDVDETPEQVAAQLRKLLPEAASLPMPALKFDPARLFEQPSQPLTAILLGGVGKIDETDRKYLPARTEPPAPANGDFVNPAFHQPQLLQANEILYTQLTRTRPLGYATFLQPECIAALSCQLDKGTARGTITYHAKDLFQGKVDYVARRIKNGGWQIDEFRLPKTGIATHRQPDGKWAITEFHHLLFRVSAKAAETRLLPDGSNAEPVEITLHFENTGDQPIKLDQYLIMDKLVKLNVQGPEGGFQVIQQPVTAAPPVLPPRDTDFPVIAPGKTHRYIVQFPGFIYQGAVRYCVLRKLGQYRITMKYDHTEIHNHKLAAGSWQGAIAANEIVIDVKPAGARAGLPGLIDDLDSKDGKVRAAASKKLFDMGKDVLPQLKEAGAKQISPYGTIRTRRLDLVYSLIDGLNPSPAAGRKAYQPGSFGLVFEPGTTRDEVIAIGKKHGFALDGNYDQQGFPNCYVTVTRGTLAEVLTALLAGEPKVISGNLNYVE